MKSKRQKPDTVIHSRSIAVARLHRITVYTRWLTVVILWSIVGTLSLWSLRREIELWLAYFTWVSVLYALVSHPLAALGLGICISMTLSVLVWQSRNILCGLSRKEELHLVRQVRRIRAMGTRHPLWKWVIPKSGSRRID